LETRWLGVDLQPCDNGDRLAIVRKKWDDKGREVEIAYFDQIDQPARSQKLGVARISTSFDDAKNLREDRYYDVVGNPTPEFFPPWNG
jgi:hypothetical protein